MRQEYKKLVRYQKEQERLKAASLNTTMITPLPNRAKEERDEMVNEQRAQGIFSLRPEIVEIIERLAKKDLTIAGVWRHYTVEKKTTPVNANDIKYFWEKLAAEMCDVEETLEKVKKSIASKGN